EAVPAERLPHLHLDRVGARGDVVATAAGEGRGTDEDEDGTTQSRGAHEAATKVSRSCRVRTPMGLPSSCTSTASAFSSRETASLAASVEPMVGSAADMWSSTRSVIFAAPVNSASRIVRSDTEPATSAATMGGSARTTGIWLTPYSWRMWTA